MLSAVLRQVTGSWGKGPIVMVGIAVVYSVFRRWKWKNDLKLIEAKWCFVVICIQKRMKRGDTGRSKGVLISMRELRSGQASIYDVEAGRPQWEAQSYSNS